MLDHLTKEPQRIAVIGDVYVAPETIAAAVRGSMICNGEIMQLYWGPDDKQEFANKKLKIERFGSEAEDYAEGLDDVIKDINIIVTHFCPLPERLLKKAGKLKAILSCSGGFEHIDVDYASKMNIPVVNVMRNTEPVADFALGMIISLTRNIASAHHGIMTGKWLETYPNSQFTTTLSSLTVGLIGMGNIGIALALRLKALQVPMIAFDDFLPQERMLKNGLEDVKMVSSLQEIFSSADVISLHLRLVESNAEIIDRKCFSVMKPSAYFINTARGGLVNYGDLLDVLERKAIAGAALDVYDNEPLDLENRLLKLDNVLMTPHIAGSTVDAVPQSPYMLLREADKIFSLGITDRIVNLDRIHIPH